MAITAADFGEGMLGDGGRLYYPSAISQTNGTAIATFPDISPNAQHCNSNLSTSLVTIVNNFYGAGKHAVRYSAIGSSPTASAAAWTGFPSLTRGCKTLIAVIEAGPDWATTYPNGSIAGNSATQNLSNLSTTKFVKNYFYEKADETINRAHRCRLNYTKTSSNALNVNPRRQIIILQVDEDLYPTGLILNAIFNRSSGRGADAYLGLLALLPNFLSEAEEDALIAKLAVEFNVPLPARAAKIVGVEGGSSVEGFYYASEGARAGWFLNGNGTAASVVSPTTPLVWNWYHTGLSGDSVLGGMSGRYKRNIHLRNMNATDRPARVLILNPATNGISSGATVITAATEILGIMAWAEFYRTYSKVTILGCKTIKDRATYGTQITGGQAEFDQKRLDVNTFLRANVWPAWHKWHGQKIFDYVSDIGASTIPRAMTLSDGTVFAGGEANPLGTNGAQANGLTTGTGGSGGNSFKWFARAYGVRATAATNPAGGWDGVHFSDLGCEIEDFIHTYDLNAALPTSAAISPTNGTYAPLATQQFTAPILPATARQDVMWSCTIGTITSTGFWTAPMGTYSIQNGTVTATSVGDETVVSTTNVTVSAMAYTAPPGAPSLSAARGITVLSSGVAPTGATLEVYDGATLVGTDFSMNYPTDNAANLKARWVRPGFPGAFSAIVPVAAQVVSTGETRTPGKLTEEEADGLISALQNIPPSTAGGRYIVNGVLRDSNGVPV